MLPVVTGEATVLVVGATSLIGWAVVGAARQRGFRVVPACNRHNRSPHTRGWVRVNADEPGAWNVLQASSPDVVLYCGGICDVDRCEAHPAFAHAVNVRGVEAMLEQLPVRTRLLYVSSDHVFGGDDGPYTEATPPSPISVYGHTRVEAEARVAHERPDALIVRIGLPIGPSLCGRRGHLDWLRHRHARGLPMTVIAGERRSAVWADAAAQRLLDLALGRLAGVRHITATRPCWRPELAEALCRRLGLAARYEVRHRRELALAHLGDVELGTMYDDELAAPLPAVLDTPL
jgi:dTDP-4-dehydrorhamnose reductase